MRQILMLSVLFCLTQVAKTQVVVDVITGETCINAPSVVELTQKMVKKWNKKVDENMRVRIWTFSESIPLDRTRVLLNGKSLDESTKIPRVVQGYGSPTVLINGQSATDSEWAENGFNTCAAAVPRKKDLRKTFRKVFQNRLR